MKLEDAIKSNKFKNEIHKAGLNVLYTAWWMKTLTTSELKEFSLTHEQYNVLRILNGKHPEKMCIKDIASRMIEKNSNIPRIIDRLLEKELVSREQSDSDARHTLILLTKKGISILNKATKKVDAILSDTVNLSIDDAIQLNEILEKMRINEQ